MPPKSKSSTEFLWEVLSRSFGLDQPSQSDQADTEPKKSTAKADRPLFTGPRSRTRKTRRSFSRCLNLDEERSYRCSISRFSDRSKKKSTAPSRPTRSASTCRGEGSKVHRSRSRTRTRTRRPRASVARSKRINILSGSVSSTTPIRDRPPTRNRPTKVQFSKSSECILSPGIVRYTFAKPGKKEQRRLRRLAERGRLYMQRHGRELPEEYLDRTPTSLVSELNRREKGRRTEKR